MYIVLYLTTDEGLLVVSCANCPLDSDFITFTSALEQCFQKLQRYVSSVILGRFCIANIRSKFHPSGTGYENCYESGWNESEYSNLDYIFSLVLSATGAGVHMLAMLITR